MNAGFVRDELARVSAMIAKARQMIATGARVDLTPVGMGIDTLCRAVGHLPLAESLKLKDELNILNARLERLGDELTEQYEAATRPGPSLTAPADRN